MLGYGVDVDTRDLYEVTSLIYAAKYGHLEAASVLLQNSADHYMYTSDRFLKDVMRTWNSY
ncbi:hypothetical protein BDV11DRAFT_186608 [Aspergillus similis]